MEVKDVIRAGYLGAYEFNDIAGNLTNVSNESIDTQITFCFEELCEAIDAFEAGDKGEFVKEVVDMFVVLSGLMQKMEAQGYDVATAMLRVSENNLSKYPKVGEMFGNPDGHRVELNESYQRVMLKDAVGKVKKPANYVKVNCDDLVPKE